MCYHNLLLATGEQKKQFPLFAGVQAGQQHHWSRKDCPTQANLPVYGILSCKMLVSRALAHTSKQRSHKTHLKCKPCCCHTAPESRESGSRTTQHQRTHRDRAAQSHSSSTLQGPMPRAPCSQQPLTCPGAPDRNAPDRGLCPQQRRQQPCGTGGCLTTPSASAPALSQDSTGCHPASGQATSD